MSYSSTSHIDQTQFFSFSIIKKITYFHFVLFNYSFFFYLNYSYPCIYVNNAW